MSDFVDVKNLFLGINILVAEDTRINRDVLHYMLKETGISIDFAVDGKNAFEIFKANPEKFKLIMMDIHMPKIDGYEAARRIRSSGGLGKQIPIIAVTANREKIDIDKCFAAGMNGHIAKPVNLEELLATLKKYLA